MADTSLRQTTTTAMTGGVPNFSVSAKIIDEAGQQKETYWTNPYFAKNLGYYKTIPELKKAIDALAMWTCGKGWTADVATTAMLENIEGWGEDTFDSIMWNMIVVKKINGDAYAEIIRDDKDQLINLKPLNPRNIRTVVDPKGLIIGYDLLNEKGEAFKRKKKEEIFHIVNDRVANEIHGTSVIEACQWVIDARNEAMADKRRIMHRMTIRVLEVDADDPTTLTTIKTQYKEAIKNGEVMIVPKGNVGFPDVPPMTTSEHLEWIQYLEGCFYQAVGVSKAILGGTQDFSEASSKVGMLTFEQPYMTEMRLLSQDLWNQLQIRVTFNRPVSLKEEMIESEAANTGQVGIQPNNTEVGVGRQ